MNAPVEPVSVEALTALLVELIEQRQPAAHPARVLIDAPRSADGASLADALVAPLRRAGRDTARVSTSAFWRDASLRLEYGHTDEQSYFEGWPDQGALLREVLDPLGPDGSGRYLPSLRDPITNRATRAEHVLLAPSGVLLLDGELLLGRGLPAELTVHVAVSPSARARRTDPAWTWTLPVLERYDREVRPAALADVVIRWNDPRHPAVSVRA